MREVVKGNLGNKVGFEISSEDKVITALDNIARDPNAQSSDKSLATRALVGHLQNMDKAKEARANRIHNSFRIICLGEAADWIFNGGKITKQIIRSSKTLIQEATTKLLHQ